MRIIIFVNSVPRKRAISRSQARPKMTITGVSEQRQLLELKDTPIVALLSAEYAPRCRAAVR
jgi:hypothetical protein